MPFMPLLIEDPPPSSSSPTITAASSLISNPILTPSCSNLTSRNNSRTSSCNIDLPSSSEICRQRPILPTLPSPTHKLPTSTTPNSSSSKKFVPNSPKLLPSTPPSGSRNSLPGTPRSRISTPEPFFSSISGRRSSEHDVDTWTNSSNASSSSASLIRQLRPLNQLLCSTPTPRGCPKSCTSTRKIPICPSSRPKDQRLIPWNHPQQQQYQQHQQKIEPYARRKSDPQGYLFTCFLDYSRFIPPPPPACLDDFVRPEVLQYSLHAPACSLPGTPRSSCSSFSQPGSRRLYSRPPTPPRLTRTKEVHRIAMAGAPVDVKELSNCYLFVAEVPGLKNSEVKVQVENDSILKISGERRREECTECDIKYIRIERQAGKFQRKFNLPSNADFENISAACQDGLLSVVVPKNPPPEHRRPKNFEVKIDT